MTERVEQIELHVEPSLEEVGRVIERFNAFAARHALPDALRRSFNIALDELLNNIVSYAFTEDLSSDGQRIQVVIGLREGHLEAVIDDGGRPFDPFARSAPDTSLDLDERAIGGLGIHLVKTMMDSATYERRGGRNRVTITKRRENLEP